MNNYSLDKYQKEAVETSHKNVLVVAAPGSGKTTVIINRVNYLINLKGVNPSNIIVITFTRAAARDMKKRYEEKFEKRPPFFGTFHGLFYKIIKRHCGDINIIESNVSFILIKKVLSTYLDEIGEEKVKEVLNYISFYKNNGRELQGLKLNIEKDIFLKCFEAYEGYKEEKGLLDFDDLQLKCRQLFIENPNLLEGYRKLFKFILVDEFQDCDAVQIQILKMLCEHSSVFAVGDEDQCIYGFRGSRPDCMVEFNSHFKEGKKIFLSMNYRNPKNVVELSKELISNNIMRNSKEIIPFKDEKCDINIIQSPNENEEGNKIANEVYELNKIYGINLNSIAILYRTNIESRSLIDSFIRKNIPFKLMDREYNFFEHFICRDIIAYLKLSLDSKNKESFLKIINKPFRYISKLNIQKIKEDRDEKDWFEALKDVEGLPVFQIKEIEKLRKDVSMLNKISFQTAVDFIIMDLGYHKYIEEYSRKYKMDLSELEDILDEFRNSASDFKTIIQFLAHVEEVKDQIQKNKYTNNDSVIFSTIHGVKGMEFDNIFLINCIEENIPHKNSIEENVEEERRLFYVGITRTIKKLWLCYPDKFKGKKKPLSRFVIECGIKQSKENELVYNIGDKVLHKYYGEGLIKKISGDTVDIEFTGDRERSFSLKVLSLNNLITAM